MIMNIGGPVHYVDLGGASSRPRVVYVHGLGGSHMNWNAVAPLLSQHSRAVAVDLPGFGKTPAAGRRTTVRANATVLRRFLRRLGEPSILVGNSMGGFISMIVAVEQPGSVSGLVLVNPTLPVTGTLTGDPAVWRQFLLHGIPGIGEWTLARHYATVPARRRVMDTLRRCCLDPAKIPADMVEELIAIEEELSLYGDHAGAHVAAARSIVLGLARSRAYWRRMAAIRQPVLLLHGIHDRLVPVGSARQAARRLPHWSYVELDSGHIPQMETPQSVAAAVIDWLDTTYAAHRPG